MLRMPNFRVIRYTCMSLLMISALSPGLQTTTETRPRVIAAANISGCTDTAIQGFAWLQERASEEGIKTVDLFVGMRGLPPGKHAIHIHERGECQPCADAGGHFDPGPAGNSNPDANHPYHTGDLPNLQVNEQGVGLLWAATTRITLSPGPLSILDDNGSAIIIHVDPDTYCPEGERAGCAGGGRLACGRLSRQ